MEDDKYVIDLGQKILSNDSSKYKFLFVEFSRYLESLGDGKDIVNALTCIWKKNILPIMIIEIKSDFTNVEPRSWTDGFLIVHTVYDVLTRVMTSSNQENVELHNRMIPDFIESILCFYRRLQNNYNQSLSPDYKGILNSKELLREIKNILELSESLIIKFPDHSVKLIQSPWFLQVFITENDQESILNAEWLMKIIKVRPTVVKQIGQYTVKGIGNVLTTIFDEIVFHLAVSTNTMLVEANLNCLLTILESDPSLVSLLQIRHKGLKLLILKWSMPINDTLKLKFSNTFSKRLRSMINLLDSGSVFQNDASMNLWAIMKIQAWWRSVSVRILLKKTNRTFGKFQKKYRSRKLREKNNENMLRIRKELEHQIGLTRQRRYREKLEAEVLLMETLPAPIVFKYLEKTRQEAARKIQSIWKGHRERLQLISRQQLYRKTKAVIKIQRFVRKWLYKRELVQTNCLLNKDSEIGIWHIPGLTMERKVELAKIHNKWRACHRHEFKGLDEGKQLELHHQSQLLYRRHLYGIKQSRRQDMERELTIARLEMDSKLLIFAPDLNQAIEGHKTESNVQFKIDDFHCKITPIANRAAQLHHDRIKKIEQPWWKQLLVEDPPDLEADDDMLTGPVDLDQYMILRNRLDFLKDNELL